MKIRMRFILFIDKDRHLPFMAQTMKSSTWIKLQIKKLVKWFSFITKFFLPEAQHVSFSSNKYSTKILREKSGFNTMMKRLEGLCIILRETLESKLPLII